MELMSIGITRKQIEQWRIDEKGHRADNHMFFDEPYGDISDMDLIELYGEMGRFWVCSICGHDNLGDQKQNCKHTLPNNIYKEE